MLRCLQHVVTGNVAGLLPETLSWATGVPFTGYEKQLGELELHYGIARLTACFFWTIQRTQLWRSRRARSTGLRMRIVGRVAHVRRSS